MAVRHKNLTFDRPGHATVRIRTDDGTVIYIDPWSEVIEGTPHNADIVFVSHDDYDHYDPEGIKAVSRDETVIGAYEKIDTVDLDHEVIPLPYNAERHVAGIHVQTVPAYNLPTGGHVRPNGEPYHPEGTAVGFLITIDDTIVYFCSDTDALEELHELRADVVIPPIGGRPTMDRKEAAELIKNISPDLVLPVHYNSDLVDDIETDAEAFKEEIEAEDIQVVLF